MEESSLDATGSSNRDLEAEDVPDEVQEMYDYFRDEYTEFDSDSVVAPLCTHELPDDHAYGETIGSLCDFAALKRLGIGVRMLLGGYHDPPHRLVDALPPSLEELVLRGYRKGESQRYDAYIEEFLEKKDEMFPRLKVLKGIDEEIPHTMYADESEDENGDTWWKYWESASETFEWVEARGWRRVGIQMLLWTLMPLSSHTRVMRSDKIRQHVGPVIQFHYEYEERGQTF